MANGSRTGVAAAAAHTAARRHVQRVGRGVAAAAAVAAKQILTLASDSSDDSDGNEGVSQRSCLS